MRTTLFLSLLSLSGSLFGAETMRLGACSIGLSDNFIVASKNVTGTAATGLHTEVFLRERSGERLVHLHEHDLRGLPSSEKESLKGFWGGSLFTPAEEWLPRGKDVTTQEYQPQPNLRVHCALESSQVSPSFNMSCRAVSGEVAVELKVLGSSINRLPKEYSSELPSISCVNQQ
jgi:hypothetical protein